MKQYPKPNGKGRSPRGGVDRNINEVKTSSKAVRVAPLAGAWIETIEPPAIPRRRKVAPLAGAWIETTISA